MKRTLIVPLYGCKVELFVCKPDEFRSAAPAGTIEDEDVLHADGMSHEYAPSETGGKRFILWLNIDEVTIGMVAHECFHTAMRICEYLGIEDEEAVAYLLTCLVDTVAPLIWDFDE